MLKKASLLEKEFTKNVAPLQNDAQHHCDSTDIVDYFIEEDGVKFAGRHFLVDLWDASHLDDVDLIEKTLKAASKKAGARILHSHFHTFSPNAGVSGVLVLAESHISIHTWPEKSYAALDVFMCGDGQPELVLPLLQQAFEAEKMLVKRCRRGEETL